MKALSLFCGCGGFDLGLRELGVDVVYANDIMTESCETLSKYFPETDVHNEDIREITKFPKVDLVVGGYPCQSFSLAGNRKPSKFGGRNQPACELYCPADRQANAGELPASGSHRSLRGAGDCNRP